MNLLFLKNCKIEFTDISPQSSLSHSYSDLIYSKMIHSVDQYLSHNSNGGFSFSLGHSVLYKVVHVLIIQQTDQVKGAKTGRTSQGQIPDDHGTGGQEWGEKIQLATMQISFL